MKKTKFSKKLLICMFLFLLLFTAIILFLFYKTGNEPSTLIMSVFGLCGIEGGILGWIKTSESKSKEDLEDENDIR